MAFRIRRGDRCSEVKFTLSAFTETLTMNKHEIKIEHDEEKHVIRGTATFAITDYAFLDYFCQTSLFFVQYPHVEISDLEMALTSCLSRWFTVISPPTTTILVIGDGKDCALSLALALAFPNVNVLSVDPRIPSFTRNNLKCEKTSILDFLEQHPFITPCTLRIVLPRCHVNLDCILESLFKSEALTDVQIVSVSCCSERYKQTCDVSCFNLTSQSFVPHNLFQDNGTLFMAWSSNHLAPNPKWFDPMDYDTHRFTVPECPVATCENANLYVKYEINLQIKKLAIPRLEVIFTALTMIPYKLRMKLYRNSVQKRLSLLKQLSVWSAIIDQINDRLDENTMSFITVDDPNFAFICAGFFSPMKHVQVCCHQPHLWPLSMRKMAFSTQMVTFADHIQTRELTNCFVVNTLGHDEYPNMTKNIFWMGRHPFPTEGYLKCKEDVIHSIVDDNQSLFYCSTP